MGRGGRRFAQAATPFSTWSVKAEAKCVRSLLTPTRAAPTREARWLSESRAPILFLVKSEQTSIGRRPSLAQSRAVRGFGFDGQERESRLQGHCL